MRHVNFGALIVPAVLTGVVSCGAMCGLLCGCDASSFQQNTGKSSTTGASSDVIEDSSFRFALEEAKRLIPRALDDDPDVAAASLASGQGEQFELGSPVPRYWVKEGLVTQVEPDSMFVIYRNNCPIAWLVVPSEEDRSKSNVDGNFSRIVPMSPGALACFQSTDSFAIICASDPAAIDYRGTTMETSSSEWMLNSKGQWHIGSAFGPDGQQQDFPEEWAGAFGEPLPDPLLLDSEAMASIEYSDGAVRVPLDC